MDIMSMIANASLTDANGADLGTVIAFHVIQSRQLVLTIEPPEEEEYYDDPDGGSEIEIEGTGEVTPLKVVNDG